MTRKLLIFIFTATLFTLAYANAPGIRYPTTFLGPTLKGGVSGHFYADSAYGVLGEAGPKNLRLNGTVGLRVEDDQYFKLSAEYLLQKLTYGFVTGNTDEWVAQMALGGAYQYNLQGAYDAALDMSAFMSYAPSKPLGTGFASFVSVPGTLSSVSEERRIAGSFGAGLSPGLSMKPWRGAKTHFALNYDRVKYDNTSSPYKLATGFGGTAGLQQAVANNMDLNLNAAMRAPFNNYQAGVIYYPAQRGAGWELGVDTAYTAGKYSVPNSWNVGLSINYRFTDTCPVINDSYLIEEESLYADGPVYKDKAVYKDRAVSRVIKEDRLLSWTETPAVYMPEVLAVTDSEVTIPAPECGGTIGLSGSGVPAITLIDSPGPSAFATAGAFTPASGLEYSVSTNVPPALGNAVSIDSTTGVLTVTAVDDQELTYTVTATNRCGQSVSASSTISIIFTA